MDKTSPKPLLMPIQSEALALTSEQQQAFAKWRQENMAPAMKLATEIINTEKAIEEGALKGLDASSLEVMIKSVLQKQHASK